METADIASMSMVHWKQSEPLAASSGSKCNLRDPGRPRHQFQSKPRMVERAQAASGGFPLGRAVRHDRSCLINEPLSLVLGILLPRSQRVLEEFGYFVELLAGIEQFKQFRHFGGNLVHGNALCTTAIAA